MVLRVSGNIREVRRSLQRDQRRQVPFAASLALNGVAFEVRRFVVERLYPQAFPRAKNRRFPAVAFRVQKSSKRRLQSAVFDRLERYFFFHHIMGRPKRPFASGSLAVPVGVTRTATGRISRARQPQNARNAFEADLGGGPAIWQRQRGGKRLKLLYVLRTSTPVRRSFRFFEAGERRGEQAWPREFEKAIARAISTAR